MSAFASYLAAAVFSVSVADSARSEPTTDLSIIDERAPDFEHEHWVSMPAYYIAAPTTAKRQMDRAIASAIEARSLLCLRESSCAWLKNTSRWRYLRAILGSGELSMNGYVCPTTVPELRYYSTHFLAASPCLPLSWDGELRSYSLSDR